MTSDTADPCPLDGQGSTPTHPQDTNSNLMAEALRCARRGWPVFPVHWIADGACTCSKGTDCGSPGKHPRTLNGVKGAATDLKTLVAWWKQWPDANIGIATGKASNLLVLDVDPQHGGDQSLDALIDQHGRLPDTVEVMTGGGGRHIYFDHDGLEGVKNSVSKLGPGLDMRSDGGYVVAPPSIHTLGQRYEWEASSHPSAVTTAKPPEWLVNALTSTGVDSSQSDSRGNGDGRVDAAVVLAGVPEGQRNDTLFRYASRHRGLGIDIDEAMVLAVTAGRACDPPLPDGEIKGIVHNVYNRYEAGSATTFAPLDDATSLGSPKERFPIYWGDEVEDLPAPEWLIDGIMTEGSLVVLYGPAGCGKTFLALDMAGAIAAGQPWQGRDTDHGPVIYVAAEGIGDLGLRHEALRSGRGLATLPDIGYIVEPVNLYDDGEVDRLIDQIADRHPALVVVDTLARSMDGADESFAKDMNTVIKNADRIRHATGATVMIIHHTGQDKKRERGSSALKAAADTFISITGTVKRTMTMKCEKMKTATAFDSVQIRLKETEGSLAVVSGAMTPTLTTNDREGLTLVSTQPLTNKQWLRAFTEAGHGSKSTFNRTLKALKDKGYVEGGSGLRRDQYAITDTGQEVLGLSSTNEVSDDE